MDIVYVLEVFPSVSEYFVLQEILKLQRRGIRIYVCSVAGPSKLVRDLQGVQSLLPVITYMPGLGFSILLNHIWAFSAFKKTYLTTLLACFLDNNTNIFSIAKQLKYFNAAVYFVYKLRNRKYQHIHAHFASMPSDLAMHMAMLTRKTYSISAHAHDIYVPDSTFIKKIKNALFVLTCTKYNKKYLTNITDQKNIIHIYHGIDLSLWPFSPKQSFQESNSLKILSVARLVEKKGLIYLLKALTILRVDHHIDCVIVGEGDERDALEEFIRQNNLENLVELKGTLKQEELMPLYMSYDFFVLPCIVASNGDRDGLPNVLVEAMATGIPVITTGVSAIPELIHNGINGMIVEEKNAVAIVDAIRQLFTGVTLRKKLTLEARKTIESYFDIKHCTNKLCSVFERFIEIGNETD